MRCRSAQQSRRLQKSATTDSELASSRSIAAVDGWLPRSAQPSSICRFAGGCGGGPFLRGRGQRSGAGSNAGSYTPPAAACNLASVLQALAARPPKAPPRTVLRPEITAWNGSAAASSLHNKHYATANRPPSTPTTCP